MLFFTVGTTCGLTVHKNAALLAVLRKAELFSILIEQEKIGWPSHQWYHMLQTQHFITPCFTGRMLFLLPNQSVEALKAKSC